MRQEQISVVIPYFNSSKTITRALKSICDQTVLPNEVIIIDDCSTETKLINEIIDSYIYNEKPKYNIVILHNSVNSGPGYSRNSGWEASKGKYVAFLDSDDSWHKEKLEIQLKFMNDNPDVYLTCHLDSYMESESRVTNAFDEEDIKAKKIILNKLLFKNIISTRTVMLRQKKDSLKFHSDKYYSEDYLLWLEILCSGEKIYIIDYELATYYDVGYLGNGLSGKIEKMWLGELETLRIIKNNYKVKQPIISMALCFSSFKYLVRKIKIFMNNFKNRKQIN